LPEFVGQGAPTDIKNFDDSHILYFDAWWDRPSTWTRYALITKIGNLIELELSGNYGAGYTNSVHAHVWGLDYSKYRLISAGCWIKSDNNLACYNGGPNWGFFEQNSGIYNATYIDLLNGFFGAYVNGSASPQGFCIKLTIREL
jgi:hypothetical protein